ncbi:MAG: diadenylate cyclase CdaA [Bacteroidales bacterium]|nr:diadenylate cyclase CdaA [Anaerotignum sp.]MCI5678725.1 diadenylate cyclase CdaA [Bacteroidales bacterium]MDY3927102.1 diadenylate cyclase CdaA [Anaerotignum sp.]
MEVFKSIFDSLGITEFARPSLGITDILDILLVAYIIYKIIFWIKETRAWVLFKGILVIFALAAVATLLKLNTILWILSNTISVGIIAVIVVFQPELRKALEQLGKGKFFFYFTRGTDETDDKATQRTVDEIVKAADKMGSVKTGALILIEQEVPLGDLERTGIPIDAIVSSQLLINIFEHNTPLHDGAVIVRRNRVAAATCFLPLTDSNEISMELGTRHRAAIGASEVSDAYVIVVSEETGAISLARGGVLYRNLTPEQLRNMISQSRKDGGKKTLATIWKGRQDKE